MTTRVAKPATPDGCWGLTRVEYGRRLVKARQCAGKARRDRLTCCHHAMSEMTAREACAAHEQDPRTWIPEGE